MKKLNYLAASIILLAACHQAPPSPKNHHTNTASAIKMDTIQGYAIHPITKDSTNLELGNAITGKALPVTLTTIPITKENQPSSVPITALRQDSARLNKHIALSPRITSIPQQLPQFTPGKDTLSLPTTLSVQGKVVPALRTPPIKASLPAAKDNATTNIRCLGDDQGNPATIVMSTIEDSRGDLWFTGLGNGVTRYTGTSYTSYAKKQGLSFNIGSALLEDSKGNLWIGTWENGINKFDGEKFVQFTTSEGFPAISIQSIFEDSKGNLWFGSRNEGMVCYDGKHFTHFSKAQGLPSNFIADIMEDKNGHLWFATGGAGILHYDGVTFTQYSTQEGLSGNEVYGILEDQNGNIWAGTEGGGACMFNGKTFSNYTTKEGLCSNSIYDILEDRDGTLWFASRGGGISQYRDATFTNYTEENGLPSNIVFNLSEDTQGNIWLSTVGGIGCHYRKKLRHFTQEQGLVYNITHSICEDQKGNLWIGTVGGGASYYDGKTFTHLTLANGLSSNHVSSIVIDREGIVWLATTHGGINRFDGKTLTTYTNKQGLPSNNIYSTFIDSNNRLWVNTNNGVAYYDEKGFTQLSLEHEIGRSNIRNMTEDREGNLWFATDKGIGYYNGNYTLFTEKEGLPCNSYYSVFADRFGKVWMGSDDHGVVCFDGVTFTNYTQQQGLPSNIIRSITADHQDQIWVNTSKGMAVLRMDDHEKPYDRFTSITKENGLKGIEFYPNSLFMDAQHRLWSGSSKCLSMLYLDAFEWSNHAPIVQLDRLEIQQQFIDFHNLDHPLFRVPFHEALKTAYDQPLAFVNLPQQITLPHHLNHLTFFFHANDWAATEKLQYSFKMEGLSSNWSTPDGETKVDYRNLPPGHYTFKVKAIGEAGVWGEPMAYSFRIYPPWWLSWGAKIFYLLFIIGTLIGIVRWRTYRLSQRQKHLQQAVTEKTAEVVQQKKEVETQRDLAHEQRQILEEKNKEITDSITYAKRIQEAILLPDKVVKQYLPQSFILYKPKEIVAGDFYWIRQLDDCVLFAAADCTGHGVPGAMVSVVCNNGLNRAVREYQLTDPAAILNKTREIVVTEFGKSDDAIRDGMDIALCALKGKKLHFAGAYNPLWIIRVNDLLDMDQLPDNIRTEVADQFTLIEIKGDKQPIGKFTHGSPFTTHSIDVQKGDAIYLFSDGFSDQFGGENGKKLKARAFKQLLLRLQHLSMEQQYQAIDNAFEQWKGDLEQVDDVCVIGVRV